MWRNWEAPAILPRRCGPSPAAVTPRNAFRYTRLQPSNAELQGSSIAQRRPVLLLPLLRLLRPRFSQPLIVSLAKLNLQEDAISITHSNFPLTDLFFFFLTVRCKGFKKYDGVLDDRLTLSSTSAQLYFFVLETV